MVFPGRHKKACHVFPRDCLGLDTPNLCFLLLLFWLSPHSFKFFFGIGKELMCMYSVCLNLMTVAHAWWRTTCCMCVEGGKGVNSMVQEVYFLSFECND